jgi:uncharacterized protein Yka (UPF0111/DUF47 family)
MAIPFVEVLLSATQTLKMALAVFCDFKKTSELKDRIVQVNDLEEVADRLYAEGMKSLYRDYTQDPVFVMIWSNLFERMERCADACENVSDMMATAALKHS